MTLDPIHQFNINNVFTIGTIGGHTIAYPVRPTCCSR